MDIEYNWGWQMEGLYVSLEHMKQFWIGKSFLESGLTERKLLATPAQGVKMKERELSWQVKIMSLFLMFAFVPGALSSTSSAALCLISG